MKWIWLALVAGSLATPVSAQTLVSYQLQVYQPGVNPATGTPFQTDSIPASAVVCNQAPVTVPSGTVFNPRTVAFNDPSNAGRACVVDRSAFLLGLPIPSGSGAYVATMTVTDDRAMTSARSAASNPFSRANPPGALTGLTITP